MTVISIEQFRQELDRYLAESTATDIILTRAKASHASCCAPITSNNARNQDESVEDSAAILVDDPPTPS